MLNGAGAVSSAGCSSTEDELGCIRGGRKRRLISDRSDLDAEEREKETKKACEDSQSWVHLLYSIR
jgi:hypothetical protein